MQKTDKYYAWGITGPVVWMMQNAGRQSWLMTTIVGTLAALLLVGIFYLCKKKECCSKWVACVAAIWVTIKLNYLLSVVGDCWIPDDSRIFVPLALLGLAVVLALKGEEKCRRSMPIIFWCVILGAGVLIASAMRDMEWTMVLGTMKNKSIESMVGFLLPLAIVFLPSTGERRGLKWLVTGLCLSVALVAIQNGVLGQVYAMGVRNTAYELSRSVGGHGGINRIEPIVIAIMALGWFSVLLLHLTAAGEVSKRLLKQKQLGIAAVAVLAVVTWLLSVRISWQWLLGADMVLCTVLWMDSKITRKNKRKTEKST